MIQYLNYCSFEIWTLQSHGSGRDGWQRAGSSQRHGSDIQNVAAEGGGMTDGISMESIKMCYHWKMLWLLVVCWPTLDLLCIQLHSMLQHEGKANSIDSKWKILVLPTEVPMSKTQRWSSLIKQSMLNCLLGFDQPSFLMKFHHIFLLLNTGAYEVKSKRTRQTEQIEKERQGLRWQAVSYEGHGHSSYF